MSLRSKFMLFLFSFLLTIPGLYPKNPIRLTIPVRIQDVTVQHPLYHKEDIQLFINGRKREIILFEHRIRSMGFIPELQRHIILSFQISEYRNDIKKRISYIITEILNPGDNLILATPFRIYEFITPRNKENLFQKCDRVLTRDLHKYHQTRNSSREILARKINILKAIYRRPEMHSGPFIATVSFLNNYPPEFKAFKDRYLTPDPQLYHKVNQLLQLKEGGKWWIHFHNHETYDIFVKSRNILNDIDRYLSTGIWNFQSLRMSVASKVNQLKQHLFIEESFPQGQIIDSLLKSNTSLNILLLGQIGDVPSHDYTRVTSDLERIMSKMTGSSGGLILHASEPAQEISQLKLHKDRYYELGFKCNTVNDHKTIRLASRINSKTNLSHPLKFTAREIQKLIEFHSRKKVTIANLSNQGNQLNFDVHSFKLNSGQEKTSEFGLLRIFVSLSTGQKHVVYKSQRTLRASKEKLEVVLELPAELKGKYFLNVRVTDLLSNRQARISKQVYLN